MERLPSRPGGYCLDLDSTIVVADLSVRLQSLIKKETRWEATALESVEVADVLYESKYASRARRVILIRRRVDKKVRGGGKLLVDCPGYKFQALVTNLPARVSALQVWLDDNGRAGMESVIKELRAGFGVPGLCCQKFFATEAALSLAVLSYNLVTLFARHPFDFAQGRLWAGWIGSPSAPCATGFLIARESSVALREWRPSSSGLPRHTAPGGSRSGRNY